MQNYRKNGSTYRLSIDRLKWVDRCLRLGTETRAGLAHLLHVTPAYLSHQMGAARKLGLLPPVDMGRKQALRYYIDRALNKLPEKEIHVIHRRGAGSTDSKEAPQRDTQGGAQASRIRRHKAA